MKLLSTFVCFLLYTASAKEPWTPRHGTIEYPKDPQVNDDVRAGDVYHYQDEYYRAKVSGKMSETEVKFDWSFPVDDAETPTWRRLKVGSFLHPKLLGFENCFEDGDIVCDKNKRDCYRIKMRQQENEKHEASSSPVFHRIYIKSEWMSLLRPEIGDKRLGDIILPGTHDTGTWGIDENSYLVDRNFLFQVADLFDPAILANWSLTHADDMTAQLHAGFRNFDMRIADLENVDGSFRWWHGVTGDHIEDALDQIAEFASNYTEEIVILEFGHFAAPGDGSNPIYPIPDHRKDVLSELLISKLESRLASKEGLSDNPTMNEVLATGNNIIAIIEDDYILGKHEAFWPSVIHSEWVARTNPESLFTERSSKLVDFRLNHADRITGISGAVTPNEQIIVAGLLRVYGDDELIRGIIEIIAPELLEINPDLLSFEGLFTDLLALGREVNTRGMQVRDNRRYSSGVSAHYHGINDAFRYWLARPGLYKPNEIHIDDFESSTVVDTAILANMGEISREVAIAFQGTSLHGFYRWDDDSEHAIDGDAAYNCSSNRARWSTTSKSYAIDEGVLDFQPGQELIFTEGQLPVDTMLTVEVGSDAVNWYPIFYDNIHEMIVENRDTYLRGVAYDDEHGFAYVSDRYDVFSPGVECKTPPDSNDVTLIVW